MRRQMNRRFRKQNHRSLAKALLLSASVVVGAKVLFALTPAPTPRQSFANINPVPSSPSVAPGATSKTGDFLDELYGTSLDQSDVEPAAPLSTSAPTPLRNRARVYADARTATIAVVGEIKAGNADDLGKALATMPKQGAITLSLSSSGGDFFEAMRMADRLRAARRQHRLLAFVPAGRVCASSCITFFAMADERYVGRARGLQDGSLFVHTPAIDGRETGYTKSLAVTWARMLSSLGAPDGVITRLVVTSAREGSRVTSADLRAWSVTVVGETGVASLP